MNDKWAYYWVNRYSWVTEQRADIDREDLFQAARLGIEAAEKGYNPELGSWAVYSGFFIKKEFSRLIGRPMPKMESLDAAFSDDNSLTLHDVLPDQSIPDSDYTVINEEMLQAVRDAVARLPDQQREFITYRYFEGLGINEIAKLMQINPVRANGLDKNAKRRLRRDRLLRENSFHHVSVNEFRSTHTSIVEQTVLHLEREDEKLEKN